MIFFTDRDLGKRFPELLAGAGLQVEQHADHFAASCPDDEWLATVGNRGWVVVTHDGRIRYKPNELAAVIRHRVALLVVIGRAPYPQLAANFIACLPQIVSFVSNQQRPFIAKIYRPAPLSQ